MSVCLFVFVCVCVCVHTRTHRCSRSPGEGVGSSGVGVPDSYELLRVGAGNPELRSFGCLSVLVVGETPASWTSSEARRGRWIPRD